MFCTIRTLPFWTFLLFLENMCLSLLRGHPAAYAMTQLTHGVNLVCIFNKCSAVSLQTIFPAMIDAYPGTVSHMMLKFCPVVGLG